MNAVRRQIDMTLSDTSDAIRHLMRTPGRSLAVVLILSVGIGLNTALFSVAHSVVTRPPVGVPAAHGLVRIRGTFQSPVTGGRAARLFTLAEVEALRAESAVFAEVAASTRRDAILKVGPAESPFLGSVTFVTPGWFEALGVRPVVGRTPTVGDGDSGLVAVVSYEIWMSSFGGGPDAIGGTLHVDGRPVTVVGVAPPGFRGVDEEESDRVVWVPLRAMSALTEPVPGGTLDVESPDFSLVARLSPGVSPTLAETAARTVSATAESPSSDATLHRSADVVPLLAYNAVSIKGTDVALAVATGIGLIVLLIVGTNVGVLLAGAAVERGREVSLRLALGASRARVVRKLLLESMVLSVTAAVLGMALLWAVLVSAEARFIRQTLIVDWATLVVSAGLALCVGLLGGLAPALSATRTSLAQALAGGSASAPPSRLALQRRLLVLQVAVSQPLLLGVALLVAFSIDDARGAGHSPVGDNVAVIELSGAASDAPPDELEAELASLVSRIEATPGVTAVATRPTGFRSAAYRVPGGATEKDGTSFRARDMTASPGFFELAGARLLQGRDFVEGEDGVVIVGKSFARLVWGESDPLGRRLVRGSRTGEGTEVTVIGVVDDQAIATGYGEAVWTPPEPGRELGIFHSVYARTRRPAIAMIPLFGLIAHREARALAVKRVTTMASIEADGRDTRTTLAGVASGGGILALLLASVGLFASSALAVRQRTREIGIRMALGARHSALQRLFVRDGLTLVVVGLLLGLPLSVLTLRWGLSDLSVPSALLGLSVAAVILSVTTLATWLPARRAAAVNPMEVLKE